jgi:O-antigen biosynthesis protein WbqL
MACLSCITAMAPLDIDVFNAAIGGVMGAQSRSTAMENRLFALRSRIMAGALAVKRPRWLAATIRDAMLSDGRFHTLASAKKPLPNIGLLVRRDLQIRSDHMAYCGEAAITDNRLYPKYVQEYVETGTLERVFHFNYAKQARAIETPIFCVTHFNMQTYGHFLLEVLPKVLLGVSLIDMGAKAQIAFPMNVNRVRPIIESICRAEHLLPYDSSKEYLRAARVILPSTFVSAEYDLHDAFVVAIKGLIGRFTGLPSALALPGPRIFISRLKNGRSFRLMENESELMRLAESFGFQRFHPEDWSWPDQVRIFAAATHVIGEYTSALHNTLFSPPGTKVLSLGRLNNAQQAIADAMGHDLAFVLPRGESPTYRPGWTEQQPFIIAENDFLSVVQSY